MWTLLVNLGWLWGMVVGAPPAAQPARELVLRETAAGVAPRYNLAVQAIASPDRRRVAFRVTHGGMGWRAARASYVVNAVEGEIYDSVDSFVFSPDSQRFAYYATNAKKRLVVVQGKVVHEEEDRGIAPPPDSIRFSPDSKRLVYVASPTFAQTVMVDGVTIGAHKRVTPPYFSPDSKRVAYHAKDLSKGAVQLNIDGVGGKWYGQVLEPYPNGFSPDGKRYGYLAEAYGEKFVAVVDGEERAAVSVPCFSPDGRVAYATKEPTAELWSVVVDGVKFKEHAQPVSHFMTFSPDGKRLAYMLAVGTWRAGRAVVDGVEGKQYDIVSPPQFSPDSRRTAYRAKSGGRVMVVLDGVESAAYQDVFGIVFSPDSKHLAHAARTQGKWTVVLDGTAGQPCDDVYAPGFSPDSRHLAYAAKRDGKWRVVVDGIEGGEYSEFVGGRTLEVLGTRLPAPEKTREFPFAFATSGLLHGVAARHESLRSSKLFLVEIECPRTH